MLFLWKMIKVGNFERALLFRDGEFMELLGPGTHRRYDPMLKLTACTLSVRQPWIEHSQLDVIARSGVLRGQAEVVELKDHERAVVMIDGRFARLLRPGLHALWSGFREVGVEVVDARVVKFEHPLLGVIVRSEELDNMLGVHDVEAGHTAVWFHDGEYQGTLDPGTHAFWRGLGKVVVHVVDLREVTLDVSGQEIMTADKVTLRLNASVVYRVVDARRAVSEVEDAKQALYREAQLALRAVVGTRELDGLLGRKDEVASELEVLVAARAESFGVKVISLGIKDVILPGEMRDLMNKVTEARKAAEASLVTRREETAAMRSQANTAKILESNPTLMRLRELEVLETVAAKSNLNIVLGEKGLVERVAKLL